MLSKSQVSEALHGHDLPFIPDVSRANTTEPSKSEKQTLVAAFAWHFTRLGDTRLA